jgi:hypothetical protein
VEYPLDLGRQRYPSVSNFGTWAYTYMTWNLDVYTNVSIPASLCRDHYQNNYHTHRKRTYARTRSNSELVAVIISSSDSIFGI